MYLWNNLINRFYQYYSLKYLTTDTSICICNALLKHGYYNFSLIIIEYCEPYNLLEREDYFFKLLKPE